MALPKIKLALFNETLPSNKKKVVFRPFTVKEEKILLIAKQSNEIEQALLSMKQVINNVIHFESGEELDIGKMPMIDLEYMLLKIRSKSVSNIIELNVYDEETEVRYPVNLDIEDMKVSEDPTHTNIVDINENVKLYLKYPTIDMVANMSNKSKTEAENAFELMLACLDKLVTEEEVHNFDDEEKETVIDFLDNLDASTIHKIRKFFDTLPKIRHEIKFKNSLGNEKTFVIEGIDSFFI